MSRGSMLYVIERSFCRLKTVPPAPVEFRKVNRVVLITFVVGMAVIFYGVR